MEGRALNIEIHVIIDEHYVAYKLDHTFTTHLYSLNTIYSFLFLCEIFSEFHEHMQLLTELC